MKKLFIICMAFTGIALQATAQYSAVDYKSEDFAQFKASKTYVVRTGDALYDKELEGAMKESWKITSFDFIDSKTFETKITDKSASFIVSITIEVSGPNQAYHYLALINGGRKKIKAYGYDDMIAYAVINHWMSEKENTDCGYRVRNMLESMVEAISLVQKNDIKGNSKKIVDGLRDVYQSRSSKIKERTLLFPSYMINSKLSKSDIAGLYPYKFEVCDKAKIEQAIKDRSKEYYYYQPAITLNKSMFVFDPSNGEVVYCDYAIMGMTIKKDDIEDLVNTIKGVKK